MMGVIDKPQHLHMQSPATAYFGKSNNKDNRTKTIPPLIKPLDAKYIKRGWNLIHSASGCFIARWAYVGTVVTNDARVRNNFEDCEFVHPQQVLNCSSTIRIQHHDTIYVPFAKLEPFMEECSDRLFLQNQSHTPIILILGQSTGVGEKDKSSILQRLLSVPTVLYIFCMDMKRAYYGPEKAKEADEDDAAFPSNLKPWPLGLSYLKHPHPGYDPTGDYQRVLQDTNSNMTLLPQHQKKTIIKTQNILVANIQVQSNPAQRRSVPHIDEKVPLKEFYRRIAASRYVLSPDGLRPECHRHYEALGLGAIPVTQLPYSGYWHLQYGPVIFNNTQWDIEKLASDLVAWTSSSETTVTVQRNMIFEEYWMEYAEKVVGRPLVWWDRLTETRRTARELFVSS